MNKDALATVLVCAWNEERNLPFLLYSLARSSISLDVLIVNNASTDGTEQVANELGAKVVNEEKPGLIHALITGFRTLSEQNQTKPILLTDADSFAQPNWAASMMEHAKTELDAESGGQLFAPVIFTGSLQRDILRTSISLALDYKFWSTGFSRPHGPNSLILPSADGRLLEQVGTPLEKEIVTGTDDFIHHRVREAGGKHTFSFNPESFMFTSGSRYKSIASILKAYLSSQYKAELYRDWQMRQPEAVPYFNKDKPKTGRYR